MKESYRKIAMIAAVLLGLAALLYLGGVIGQILTNYSLWMEQGGMGGQITIQPVNFQPGYCFLQAFSSNGIKGTLFLLAAGIGVFAYIRLHNKLENKEYDSGMTISAIAKEHGRSKGGIEGKLAHLGKIDNPYYT